VDFTAEGDTLAVGLANDPLEGRPAGEDVFLLDARSLVEQDRIEVPDDGLGGIRLIVDQPGTDRLLLGHCCSGPPTDPGYTPPFLALYDRSEARELWRVDSLEVSSAAFGADGARLLVGGHDGRIEVLDAADGATIEAPVAAHDGSVRRAELSPDRDLVLSAGTDDVVRLWTAEDLQPSGTFDPGDGSGVGGGFARFADDGRSVVMFDGGRVWAAPIDLQALHDHVCAVTDRDLTPQEWTLLLPDRAQEPVC